MNVEITEKTEVTKLIANANCKVTMLNGEITSIHVERADYVGGIEFEKKFGEFGQFVQNLVDVYHAVRLDNSVPHAVTSTSLGIQSRHFCYDRNGRWDHHA